MLSSRSDDFALKKCYSFLSARVTVTNFRQNDIKDTNYVKPILNDSDVFILIGSRDIEKTI